MHDMIQPLKQMFNFTIECIQDPDGDWGTSPKTGWWDDDNATFSGALGR